MIKVEVMMRIRIFIGAAICTLMLVGCATKEYVSSETVATKKYINQQITASEGGVQVKLSSLDGALADNKVQIRILKNNFNDVTVKLIRVNNRLANMEEELEETKESLKKKLKEAGVAMGPTHYDAP